MERETTQSESTDDETRDTSQLIGPDVDTASKLSDKFYLWWLTSENILYYLAIVGGALLVLPTLWAHNATAGKLGFAVTVAVFTVYWLVDQITDHNVSVRDRLGDTLASRYVARSLPWTREDALAKRLHGVEEFITSEDGNGVTKMDDGRMVAHVDISGCNTAKQERREADELVQQLSTTIDSSFADMKWSFVFSAEENEPTSLSDRWFERARGRDRHPETARDTSVLPDAGQRAMRVAREYLEDASDWIISRGGPSPDARRWDHTIAIEVFPSEVEVTAQEVEQALGDVTYVDKARSWADDVLPWVDIGPRGLSPDGTTRASQLVREAMLSKVDKHVTTVCRGVGSIDGVDATGASVLRHGEILLRYWSGQPELQPEDGVFEQFEDIPADAESWNDDRILDAFRRDGSATRVRNGERPEQRWLAPDGVVDVRDGDVFIGSQLTRTYRIDTWTPTPDAHFLADLWEETDVNVDGRIHAKPLNKSETIADLGDTLADLDINIDDAAEARDYSAAGIGDDKAVLKSIHDHLRNTSSQPWAVTGYITVRVSPDEALDWMARTGREFETLFPALRQALDEKCETVVSALASERAGISLKRPGTPSISLFEAASPSGRDAPQAESVSDQSTLMLGGALGAMFPFSTSYLDDPDEQTNSMFWGINRQNLSPILTSLFGEEGEGKHAFTFGQTRSGKTFFVQCACALWYLMKPWDRTLILCDTEGGFTALTKLLSGKHIKLDGSTTINPFDIQPARETDTSGTSHFQMKQDEVLEFFISLLREIGRDPGRYKPVIQEGISQTYRRAGIGPDPETHGKESPPPSAFIDVLDEMAGSSESFTISGEKKVTEDWSDIVAELLNILNQFKEGGKYGHMAAASSSGLLDEDVRVAYVDLSNFSEASDAMKAVQMQLVFGQVLQKFKRAHGKKLFVADEAHFLLHSETMVDYLQDAARSVSRYSAALWFVTQSPREFIERREEVERGGENKRRTILEQCSVIQGFRTPGIQLEMLQSLGMNKTQAEFLRDEATKGTSGHGYSECLISIQEERGWFHSRVVAHPFAQTLWSFRPTNHASFDEFLDTFWDWRRGEPIGAGPGGEDSDDDAPAERRETSPAVAADGGSD